MGNKMRDFDIAFVGLKPGTHQYEYEVDKEFFEKFSESDFIDCNARVKVTLEKSSQLMLLKFDVDGVVDVLCDRCASPLKIDLWDEFNLVVKQVENPEEMNDEEEDPDILYIGRTESHLHLAKLIYEFVLLSIPNQRIHGTDANGVSLCNKEVLDMLKKMEERTSENSHPFQKNLEQFKKTDN